MRFLTSITLALAAAALLSTTATAMPVAPAQQCTFTADFQGSGEGSASVTYAGTLTMHADPDNAGVYFIDTLTGTRTEGTGAPQTIVALDHDNHTPRFAGSSTQGAFSEVALSLSGGDSSTIECGLGDCVDTFNNAGMLSNGHIVTSCQAKIIGDPAFVGFLGQRFQVHGTPNVVHNVISAPALLVNALFVFLDRGDCPVYNGKVMRGNCFAHPGTYFGELGFRTRSNDRVHVIAGSAKSGFDALMINGKAIAVGESVDASSADASSSLLSVTRTSTHTATVRTALFEFDIENSDMYINLLNVRIYDLRTVRSQDVHGLLGQTWRSRRGSIDGIKLKEIDGTVDDYVELDNDLFGQNVLFSRFHAEDEQDDAKQQHGEARSARVLPPNLRDVVVDDKMNGKATLIALRNRIRGQ